MTSRIEAQRSRKRLRLENGCEEGASKKDMLNQRRCFTKSQNYRSDMELCN